MPPELPPLCAVVAACRSTRGIGSRGDLPWGRSLAKELKHFARITTDTVDKSKCNAIIMGRKTWDSIPAKRKPLPNRLNIVVSRNLATDSVPPAVKVARSFNEAVEIARTANDAENRPVERIMAIGGSQVYLDALQHPAMDTLYLTEVLTDFDCDTFLKLDETEFAEQHDDASLVPEEQEENGIRYKYRVLKKIR